MIFSNDVNANQIINEGKGQLQALSTTIGCILLGALWYLLPHPFLVLLIGIAPLALFFSLRFSFFFVLMFVIFSFFRIHEVYPQLYSLKIPLLLSAAAIFSLFWHMVITGKIQIFWRTELLAACLFFCLVIVGIAMASNRPIAIDYFKNIYWKIIVMMFAIAWMTRDAASFALASKLITFAGMLVGIVAISNKLNGIGLVEETRVTIGRNLGSVLGDPNDLALVLMFPCAFAVGLLSTPGVRRYLQVFGAAAAMILFFAVIATQSRGGLLGVLAVFAVFGYRKVKSKVLLATVGGVLAMVLFVFAGISERKSGGAAEEGIDASAQGRLYAWEAAAKMAVDNPLTGVGIDNFYSNYYFYSSHWDGLNHAVHSTWFGVLAETGILGFVVFIVFIVTLVKSALRSLKTIDFALAKLDPQTGPVMQASALSLLAGLTGTIVSGTFLTHGFTWPIYILAGLIAAMSHWTSQHCK